MLSAICMKRAFVSVILFACFFSLGPNVVAQTNPVAWWAFDEGAGASAGDASGNNHSCAIVGASYVAGRSNTGLFFSGTNSYAFGSDAAAGGTSGAGLDVGTRDWTVAAWVKTTNSGMVVTK